MKTSKKLLSAIVLATAGLVSHSAYADDISHPIEVITLDDTGSAYFGGLFTGKNEGNTFSDKFSFTTTMAGALSADLSSLSGTAKNGLDITGFDLYNAGGLVLAGTSLSTGILDNWTLSSASLAAGDYYVQVTGSVLSNAAGKYYANLALAPVPEPETYGMMLGGLGVLGLLARRRRKDSA
jgi:hypothetical protein